MYCTRVFASLLYAGILLLKASKDREIVGSASVDYLFYSGYVMLAHQWALMAKAAQKKVPMPYASSFFFPPLFWCVLSHSKILSEVKAHRGHSTDGAC